VGNLNKHEEGKWKIVQMKTV